MTGVLVVEDQQVLSSALEIAIGAQPDLECVGSAATVEDALDRISLRVPDVVLMDIGLPGADGIEGTRRIKATYPQVSVLILTGVATPERLAAATAAGATGFLAKDSTFADILTAIRNPVPGKVVIEGATLRELLAPGAAAAPRRASQAGFARLTTRELEVLSLMAQGLDPRSIAERLVVSLYTARGHVKNIMMKLGAHTQLEAVVVATRSGLVPAGQDGGARHLRAD